VPSCFAFRIIILGVFDMAIIAVDIDGVLASKLESGKYPEDYVKKQPLTYAIEGLTYLKEEGHEVYLFTARYEEDRDATEKWLNEHGFTGLFDYIIFAKPKYDVLIDDRAIRHVDWVKTIAQLNDMKHTGEGKWF
jgi:hypothetical protein